LIKRGDILLSEPFLGDPNFERSAVLICEGNEEGHYGLVLNKPLENTKLSDVVDDVSAKGFQIYVGGPVEQNVLQYVHTLGDVLPGAISIAEDVYLGGDYEKLKLLLDTGQVKPSQIRFFIGYSGWSEGQLDGEMESNSWIVSNVKKIDLFEHEPDKLWRNVLRTMGGKYKAYSNYPIDPRLN